MSIRYQKRGQIAVEYVVLIIVIIGALLGMQVYMKRGYQGRFAKTVEDLAASGRGKTGAGYYYDPRYTNTSVSDNIDCTTLTAVRAVGVGSADAYTERKDTGDCSQAKIGSSATAGFDPFAFAPPAAF